MGRRYERRGGRQWGNDAPKGKFGDAATKPLAREVKSDIKQDKKVAGAKNRRTENQLISYHEAQQRRKPCGGSYQHEDNAKIAQERKNRKRAWAKRKREGGATPCYLPQTMGKGTKRCGDRK